MDNDTKLDAVDVFQKLKARRTAEAELANHKWTLEEINALQTDGTLEDLDAARVRAALDPYIRASCARGDFQYPHQMTREQAREYLRGRGIEGEPWSTAEIAEINKRGLIPQYSDEIKAAEAAGAVLKGPGTAKGNTHHFAGEDGQALEKHLNQKLGAIDKKRKADAAIREAFDQLEQNPGERLGEGAVRSFIKRQLDAVWVNGTDLFPARGRPRYYELVDAYEAAGGDATSYRPYDPDRQN